MSEIIVDTTFLSGILYAAGRYSLTTLELVTKIHQWGWVGSLHVSFDILA